MVHIIRYISAAALVTVASAVPVYRRDGSAIGSEIPVSAPFGIPMSDVPSSTDSSVAAATAAAPPPPPPPVVSSSIDTATIAPMASSMAMPPPPMASSMDSMPPPPMVSSMDSMPPPPMASMPPPPMANSMTDSASIAMMASDTMSAAMPQMTYGSGSSSMGSGYDSCVQQCAASFPMTPSATQSSGSAGSGATHTIIVAPSQGVLRYIPFSTNASVGDTVSFVWHAGPHTVTQSSALEVCNKTAAPGAFASGSQNTSFVFNQVVNNTNPIWFYCGVPNHCQKGMFGGINIGQPDPTSSSTNFTPLSSVMANLTMTNPAMSAMWTMTQSKTAGNLYASSWGMNTNCAGMSPDAMMQTAQNVMYMQTLIAANPQAVQGGKFAVTSTSNLTIPADLQIASNSTMSMASSASPSAATAASSAMPSTSGSVSSANSNGAASITSSRVVVGLVAILATFFAL